MLDLLQAAEVSDWDGTVYRHMFGSQPPTRANTGGARWNEPNLAAIYTSCERETAVAEAEYYIALQPLRPRAKRTLFTIRVSLKNVIDLTAADLIVQLGITNDVLGSIDHTACRTVGAAVNWLGYNGLLVPSARRLGGTNLVIYQQGLSTESFEVIAQEEIATDDRP
ncbi:MAG TPA: RES family NAD+ phosphorylase [Thermoanaerobaculia bacterium]|jgi:RES domain-containing protein|nr:RES family NAD+ phosphorylase [Thermoanaerobaculia bacterium]